ncbi:hypothetical protein ACWKTZ_24490 [Bacillus cereus]
MCLAVGDKKILFPSTAGHKPATAEKCGKRLALCVTKAVNIIVIKLVHTGYVKLGMETDNG